MLRVWGRWNFFARFVMLAWVWRKCWIVEKKIAIYKVGPVLMDLFKKSLCIYYWKLLHGSRISCLSSVQSLNCVRLFVTPWTAAHQASLSITNTRSLLKLMSLESVMPSNHLILCCPLLPPSIFPSIRDFSSDSALHIRQPKYRTFSFSISPSKEYSGLIPFRTDWFDLLAAQGTLKSLL